MVDHDVANGPLAHCQITGSTNLFQVIDLGHQPPCDAMLSAEELDMPELSYPLRLMLCPESGLAQLDYVVPFEELYPVTYPYRAGISATVVQAHDEMAKDLVARYGARFYIDIGSNDGVLLAALQARGCKVLGVEPTDVAKIAERENNVATLQTFFNEGMGSRIANGGYGRADVITFTNVFAHMSNLGDVMRGVCAVLKNEGVLVIENQYLLDVLQRNQFDTVYHEHLRTYSLRSFVVLLEQYGMEVFDVQRMPRYGGNIRVHAGMKGEHAVQSTVKYMLATEVEAGLFDQGVWKEWLRRVQENRDRVMHFLYEAHHNGRSVVGCSAPGRAATLLNYYGITPDLLPYTGELFNSLKLGKFYPGCHIPVISNRQIVTDEPEYVMLLAWHYGDYIMKRMNAEGSRCRFVLPLPEFKVVS